MIKAFIFDLDGVVVNTDRQHYLAWKKLANHMGYELTPFENMMLKGLSRRDSLEALLEMKGVEASEEEKEILSQLKNEWYKKMIEQLDASSIERGAQRFIRSARDAGMKTALASSSKNANSVLQKLRLNELFDVIVDGNMIERSKPDPEIFLKCAALLNLQPCECAVFEDSQSGIDAANRAGMKAVGICAQAELNGASITAQGLCCMSVSEITVL